jgi:predicted permease
LAASNGETCTTSSHPPGVMSAFFNSPASLRLREMPAAALSAWQQHQAPFTTYPQVPVMASDLPVLNGTLSALGHGGASKPDFLHLAGLVSEAVLEVVFVALPGYLVAVTGMFDANSQKFVAELNTMVFTPCLIFTKLASQLNADKLADLVVIPFIFVAQTLVSYCCAQLMSWAFGFWGKKMRRQKNFILAMAVFGNSNSLPISLVISLSKTIQGLHWDQIPGDNDDEVAARGILYLLIFQQLGQLLRWTWGYSVLLKPASAYEEEDRAEEIAEDRSIEEGEYRDDPEDQETGNVIKASNSDDSGFLSGQTTPQNPEDISSSESSVVVGATPTNGNNSTMTPRNIPSPTGEHTIDGRPRRTDSTLSQLTDDATANPTQTENTTAFKAFLYRVKFTTLLYLRKFGLTLKTFFHNLYRASPRPFQSIFAFLQTWIGGFLRGVWRQMNPPLWAMLAALLVASIPPLQHAFFTRGTFLSNSVTRAISQSGSVAVPLILVVLGANLARSTLPKDQVASSPAAKAEERKLLYAALLSRMFLPVLLMAPALALLAKFAPVSILDDPIFIIVCFLLTGAPSALQLAQICQINHVFMGAMSSLLVMSYVVWIFPSTLLLVLLALEVLSWAVFNH